MLKTRHIILILYLYNLHKIKFLKTEVFPVAKNHVIIFFMLEIYHIL